jgi:hypothetical protein
MRGQRHAGGGENKSNPHHETSTMISQAIMVERPRPAKGVASI